MAMKNRSYRWLWGVLLLAILAFGAWRIFMKPAPQAPASVAAIRSREGIPVTVHTVALTRWEHWITFFGRTQASSEVRLAAERQEYVESVLVEVGDAVSRGQVLASLDTRIAREKLYAQESLTAEMENRYRRLQSLQAAGGASSQEVESALTAVKNARAGLNDLRTAFSRMTITSPVDGVVTGRFVEKGNLVSPGQVIFTVANLDLLDAVLDVSPQDILKVTRGMPARVRTSNGLVDADIRRIDPVADASTGLFSLVLALPPDSGLIPGQTVEAIVQDEDIADAVIVPYEALKQIGGERTVIYVVSEGLAVERDVITGGTFDGKVRILSGVDPGEKIVVKGSDRMFPNARVWIQEN